MVRCDVEGFESSLLNRQKGVVAELELPDGALDGDFPDGDRAYNHAVLGIGNRQPRRLRESLVYSRPSNEGVRIEQQVHVRDRSQKV
jgi:hypothetical protein